MVQRSGVLIETYWNVKADLGEIVYRRYVLIETYWNVKSGKYTNAYFVGHVLIETYWNVKKETKVIDKSSIKY